MFYFDLLVKSSLLKNSSLFRAYSAAKSLLNESQGA